jgi:ankyrin repeat protein
MPGTWTNRVVVCLLCAVAWALEGKTALAQDRKGDKTAEERTSDLKALCYAAGLGKTDQVVALIKRGVPINSNELGKTPLILAIQGGRIETVKVLLENGADLHYPDAQNRYPIYFAYSNVEVLKYVLSKGGDKEVNWYTGATTKNPKGNGMHLLGLVCGSRAPLPEMIPILVQAGADPNKRFMKVTPLIAAIERGDPKVADVVKTLIEHKADVNMKDDAGVTPLQWAKMKDQGEVIELLRKAGAKE